MTDTKIQALMIYYNHFGKELYKLRTRSIHRMMYHLQNTFYVNNNTVLYKWLNHPCTQKLFLNPIYCRLFIYEFANQLLESLGGVPIPINRLYVQGRMEKIINNLPICWIDDMNDEQLLLIDALLLA